MKTIQITIDEMLLQRVDQVSHLQKISRSQFIRKALHDSLRQLTIQELEQKHSDGYNKQPVTSGEFDVWESEQGWR